MSKQHLTLERRCDWCGSKEDVGYVGGKEGKLFQCQVCLKKELSAAKQERLKNCPIERDLIERGYDKLAHHVIMPCLYIDGEMDDSDLPFDCPTANMYLVFEGGKDKEFSDLEAAFEYCMKAENLPYISKNRDIGVLWPFSQKLFT